MRRTKQVGLILMGLAGLVAACSPARPPERRPRPVEGASDERPRGEALRSVVELSDLVVKGKVVERLDEPTGVIYRVEVLEVLVDRGGERAAHPVGDQPLEVTTFLFQRGVTPGTIQPLEPVARYVFFLAPAAEPGEWLNLTDPAPFRLPANQDALEEVREVAGGG